MDKAENRVQDLLPFHYQVDRIESVTMSAANSIPNESYPECSISYTSSELDAAIMEIIGAQAWRYRDGDDGLSRPDALMHCGAVLFAQNGATSRKTEIMRHALRRVIDQLPIEFSDAAGLRL